MGDVVSGWSGSFNVFIKKFVPFVRKCLNIYCSPQRAGETVFFYLTFLGGIRMFKGSLNKDRRKSDIFIVLILYYVAGFVICGKE